MASAAGHGHEGEPPGGYAPVLPSATPAISGRKAVERELREGEHRLRTVLNSDFLPILFHSGGVILDTNDAAERLFGYPREELLRCNLFDLFAEEDRGRAQGYATAHGQYPYELLGLRKNGSLVHLDVEARDILLDGLPARVVFLRDASEKHHAETERLRVETHIRQAEKIEALGQLAGGVAHNFNNLLVAIAGYSELLLAKLPPGSELRPDVEEIIRAAQRAKEVTRALLVFSRREPRRHEIIDLNQVVNGIETLLHQLIRRDIEIVTVLAPGLPAVEGDPSQLEQVVVNLAVNARDAMPDGGTLTIETSTRDVTEPPDDAPLAPGRYVTLTVRDTGFGMDEETRARLFEPFFTTKGPEQGTGLGLSTVLVIVEEVGGQITVRSGPNEGTTFTIYLPASPAG